VDVVSTRPQGKYGVGAGTSDAAAIVSGVVALVRARFPALSGPEVVRRITATATDKGRPGRDDEYGFGIVDPVAALTADVRPEPPPSSHAAVPSGGAEGGKAGGTGGAVVGGVAVGLVVLAGLVVWRRRRAVRD
jgi:subtilisin family serine protease